MKALFIHQNFPGQYRHLAPALAARGHEVVGLGETENVRRQMGLTKGLTLVGYRMGAPESPAPGSLYKSFHNHVERGLVVARAAAQIRAKGFVPDLVCVHVGWGEGLFLRDLFPESRILLFCEYYYQTKGGDFGFDPQLRTSPGAEYRLRLLNAPLLMAMSSCDWGITATQWQRSRYPEDLQKRISVIHDGIDTARVRPDPEAKFELPGSGRVLTRRDKVVTYTTRNFEPYRGFHQFMRSVPLILQRDADAQIVIVGNDDVSYSPRLPEGETYRKVAMRELGNRIDPARVHFMPGLPYDRYLSLLQVSSAHIYLTYPFVLSWSMLEAMAAGCVVIGSSTAPVTEILREGENGLLVDFFDSAAIARRACEVLANPQNFEAIRTRAREEVVRNYDLQGVCLGRHVALAESLAAGNVPPVL